MIIFEVIIVDEVYRCDRLENKIKNTLCDRV